MRGGECAGGLDAVEEKDLVCGGYEKYTGYCQYGSCNAIVRTRLALGLASAGVFLGFSVEDMYCFCKTVGAISLLV